MFREKFDLRVRGKVPFLKPLKSWHYLKLANQSTLNKANVTEITKTCKVGFMKARYSLIVRCREERVNWEKKRKVIKIYFLKLQLTDFG